VAGGLCRPRLRSCPAGEEFEPVFGCGAGFGGVDDQVVHGSAGQGQVEGLEGQFQAADVGVLEPFDAVVAHQDVVRGPLAAKLGAEGGQLADEFAQCPVAGLAPDLGAQQGGGGDAGGVPVDEEVMCTGVEEDIAGDVGRPRLSMVALSNIGASRARARGLPTTTSVRPLRTNAEDIVMESSSHWTRGGTSTSLRRDGVRLSCRDDRDRSNR